jgi:hypothetical protein
VCMCVCVCVCVWGGGGSDLVGKLDNLCSNNHGGNQFNSSRVASKEVQTRIIANTNENENENGEASAGDLSSRFSQYGCS